MNLTEFPPLLPRDFFKINVDGQVYNEHVTFVLRDTPAGFYRASIVGLRFFDYDLLAPALRKLPSGMKIVFIHLGGDDASNSPYLVYRPQRVPPWWFDCLFFLQLGCIFFLCLIYLSPHRFFLLVKGLGSLRDEL